MIDCEADLDGENILEGNYWMGTVSGCKCRSYIRRSDSCNSKNGCYKIFENLKRNYTYWRDRRICAKKFQENYLDLDIEANAANCPKGTRSCGIIDTENNHLCLDYNRICPVNSININRNSNGNGKYINMGEYNLWYSQSNSNNKIPIEFKVSEGVPCMNPFFKNIPSPVYILDYYFDRQYCYKFIEYMKDSEKNSNNGYSNYFPPQDSFLQYDETYTKIDTYNMEQLYIENNIYNTFVKLPYFDKRYHNGDIHLSYKPYFGLKINCLKKIKSEKLKEGIYVDFEKIENRLNDIGILMVSFVILIISATFMCFWNFIGLCGSNDEDSFKLRICGSICCLIPLAIGFMVPLMIVAYGSRTKENLDFVFKNEDCVDNYTSKIYDKYVANNQEIRTSTVIASILSIIILIGEIILSFFMWSKTKY